MATVRVKLDPKNPPRLSEETKARLERLTDAELTANALSDPDNPPLTEVELAQIRLARTSRRNRQPGP